MNTIVHVFLYVEEQDIHDLFQLILCSFCLIVVVVPWLINKAYGHYMYVIIYNDFFEIYDKSIFDSILIRERENKKYLKIKRMEKYNYFILLPSRLYNKIYVTICYH